MARQWTSRYTAYATEHGRSPEEMLEADTERYPGGKMCGFTLWIRAKWKEWRKLFGPAPVRIPHLQGAPNLGYWDWTPTDDDHKRFDEWLISTVAA